MPPMKALEYRLGTLRTQQLVRRSSANNRPGPSLVFHGRVAPTVTELAPDRQAPLLPMAPGQRGCLSPLPEVAHCRAI